MQRIVAAIVVVAVILIVFGAIKVLSPDRAYQWQLPSDYPQPVVPQDNPMTPGKVALGRRLFYDSRLSVNGQIACASCHQQSLAFTDGKPRSIGTTGEVHPRGAMSLVNAAYASRLTWANHLLHSLEVQALTPIFGQDPVEMGMAGRENTITALVRMDDDYSLAFPAAFPGDEDPYSVLNVVRAIGAFVRSIVAFNAPYDRYLAGEVDALTDSQLRGMALFFSERLECFHCHGGLLFTDSSTHVGAMVDSVGFHNTGLYNIGGIGRYPKDNTGLHDLTGRDRDMGRFRAPTLRNITLTAPYMHDGSIATLLGVIDHYQRGGRQIEEGAYAGDGRRNPFKSEFIERFALTDNERADLIDFLAALTDPTVGANAAWSDPFDN